MSEELAPPTQDPENPNLCCAKCGEPVSEGGFERCLKCRDEYLHAFEPLVNGAIPEKAPGRRCLECGCRLVPGEGEVCNSCFDAKREAAKTIPNPSTIHFNQVLAKTHARMDAVLKSKATEYAHGGDRLSNFKDAAELNGCTPEQALWGFVTKHIIALKDFIKSGETRPLEQWEEKIGDIQNYMVLLEAIVSERK